MELIRSFETSVHLLTARRYIPQDGTIHNYRRQNLNTQYNPQNNKSTAAVNELPLVCVTWLVVPVSLCRKPQHLLHTLAVP
jgi:hypothetical protein